MTTFLVSRDDVFVTANDGNGDINVTLATPSGGAGTDTH